MILVWISGIALFLMMVVTVTDVAGRYFSGRSLTGSNEMIRMALAVSVSSALPAVTKSGAHITLELLVGQEGHPLERLRRILVNVIGAAAYAFLTWFLWQAAMEAHEFSEVIGYLELPRAPMILFGPRRDHIVGLSECYAGLLGAVDPGSYRVIRAAEGTMACVSDAVEGWKRTCACALLISEDWLPASRTGCRRCGGA
ncbi:TRAP transporter small permease [Leisingera thetidis]|uniref:TRAP transporter small permease n=1 Tax=Leisingera thetidis TaxID=2930199 RepID=UPI0021F6AA53|nr:TRAP transporter small permease [Leisingera thetidis]